MSDLIYSLPYSSRFWRRTAFAAAVTTTLLPPWVIYDKWEQLPKIITDTPGSCTEGQITVGVVYTGSEGRISRGLELLDNNVVQLLIISGNDAYPPALFERFGQRNPKIVLERKAATTEENAINTVPLLTKMQGAEIREIRLVDSAGHMWRSVRETQWQLKATNVTMCIVAEPVFDEISDRAPKIREILKAAGAELLYIIKTIGIEIPHKSPYSRPSKQTVAFSPNQPS